MKLILFWLSMFICSLTFAQTTTIVQDNINAKKSLTVAGRKITAIKNDTTLLDSVTVLTAKAVQDFVGGRIVPAPVKWLNLKDAGADFTGMVDCSSILQAAINADYAIYAPTGNYLVTNIQVKHNSTIIGDGKNLSIFKTTADAPIFKCSISKGGNNSTFQNIGFLGTYNFVGSIPGVAGNQVAIKADSAYGILIQGVKISKMNGAGIRLLYNGYCCATYVLNAGKNNIITNNFIDSSNTGIDIGVRAEYNNVSSNSITTCDYGIAVAGGNDNINNNMVVNCWYGLYITQGSNGAHGLATGNLFNHNRYPLYMNGVTLGWSFVNCNFGRAENGGYSVLELINTSNVNFIGGMAVVNDTVRTTGCSAIAFINQHFLSGDYKFVNISGTPPTVIRTGIVSNAQSWKDGVNSKQFDFAHTDGVVSMVMNTSPSTIKLAVGKTTADSTVDVLGGGNFSGGFKIGGNQAATASGGAAPVGTAKRLAAFNTATDLTSDTAIYIVTGSSPELIMKTSSTTTFPRFTIWNTGTFNGAGSNLVLKNDANNTMNFYMTGSTNTNTANAAIIYAPGATANQYVYNSSGTFILQRSSLNVATNVTMKAFGNGNVVFGGGVTDNGYKLEVGGTTNTTGNASFGGNIVSNGTTSVMKLKAYTVATLPTGAVGDMAYVSDALTPAFGVTLVGGGAVNTIAFFDGTNWTAH